MTQNGFYSQQTMATSGSYVPNAEELLMRNDPRTYTNPDLFTNKNHVTREVNQ